MTRSHLALAALLALTACGKPLLYAEVEIPQVHVTLPAQAFPSTQNPLPTDLCTGTVPAGDSCLEKSITYNLGSDFTDLTKDSVSYDLRLTDLGITFVASDSPATFQDFRDVKRVVVSVVGPPSSGLPAVDLASYEASASDPTPTTIVVGALSNVDLGAYVQAGALTVTARMEFGQNIPAFTADVAGDFYLKVLVNWGHKAGVF
jgi:predicted small lipoprotein YifL